MKEITFKIPEGVYERLQKNAAERNLTVSETVAVAMGHMYGSFSARPAIDPLRGQREDAKTDPRLDWWREARFGMFVHWGLYAIPAGVWKGDEIPGIGEWIMYRAEIPVEEYEKLAGQFNPVKFDVAQWASIAKKAGQKYLVITSKHHDGFCLFKSEHTDYNMVDGTPFGRDVLTELADECRKQGIKLGLYYSQTQDWHHPDGDGNYWDFEASEQDFDSYVDNFVKPQLREILGNYGPIGLIWFDTPKGISRRQSDSLLHLVHELQPDCLVSGRLGNSLGDYASAGDNKIPAEMVDLDWETPATLNDTWGFKTNDSNWKTVEDLLHKLVDIASKGGNYLLNVGPTAEGVIPQESVERLEAMGNWLATNGESVYGTKAGPVQGLDWCRTTKKDSTVYLHVFDWPSGGKLTVPGLTVASARLLGGDSLEAKMDGANAVIQGPTQAPDTIDTVVVLEG